MASNSTISVTFKLDGDAQSFKQLAKEADGLKKALNGTAIEAQQLPKRFNFSAMAKNLAGVTAAATAVGAAVGKFAGDAINLTQTWGDKWAVEMAGMRSAYQHLVRDLASGEGWGQLIERMGQASLAGRQLAATLDELFERRQSLSYEEATIKKQISEQQLVMRDSSKTDAERATAAQKIIELNDLLLARKRDIASQEANAYRDNFKAQTHLNDQQIDYLLRNYNLNRDIINQARAYNDERSKLQAQQNTRNANVMFGAMGGAMYSGVNDPAKAMADLEANTSQTIKDVAALVKLYDRSNDELVQSMTQAEVAVINLDTEANQAKVRATATLGTLSKGVREVTKDLSFATEQAKLFMEALSDKRARVEMDNMINDVLNPVSGRLKELMPKGASTGVTPGLASTKKSSGLPDAKDINSSLEGITALSAAMSALSGVVGSSAESWMSWASTLLTSVASIVPAIATITAAHQAAATAAMAQAETEGAAAVAAIPVVGPGMAVAAAATIAAALIASIAAIPKFADGGIAFGPTLGLFGEYAGASNNPEVVAPLDKLRGMLFDGGAGLPTSIELKAKGRDLYAVLSLENDIRRRS